MLSAKLVLRVVLASLFLFFLLKHLHKKTLHTPPKVFNGIQSLWYEIAQEAKAITGRSNKVRRRDQWISSSVKEDIEKLAGNNDKWLQTWTNSGDWLEYPLMIENEFVVQQNTTERCPITCRALDDLKSSGIYVKIAGFSRLQEGKHIPPHTDDIDPEQPSQPYHLGLWGHGLLYSRDSLETQPDGCIQHQQPGQSFVFDSSFPHSVLNVGNEDRIILYINYHTTS